MELRLSVNGVNNKSNKKPKTVGMESNKKTPGTAKTY